MEAEVEAIVTGSVGAESDLGAAGVDGTAGVAKIVGTADVGVVAGSVDVAGDDGVTRTSRDTGEVLLSLLVGSKLGKVSLSAILDDVLAEMSVEETAVGDDGILHVFGVEGTVEVMMTGCSHIGAHCQSLGAAIVNDRGV